MPPRDEEQGILMRNETSNNIHIDDTPLNDLAPPNDLIKNNKIRYSNSDEAEMFENKNIVQTNDVDTKTNVQKCSCYDTQRRQDDDLEAITSKNLRYYNAVNFYETNLRRGVFTNDVILKIKKAVGGEDNINLSKTDFDKICLWQCKNGLFKDCNSADGQFGKNSIKKYNESVPDEEKISVTFRKININNDRIASNPDVLNILTMNDKTAIPLSEDDSNGCTFKEDVNEFLDKYSRQQNVPFSYIEKLVSHRNFALITLLIAVANYGVVDIPKDSDLKSKDPLVAANEIDVDDGFENFTTGKNAYAFSPVGSEYPINGGLGIAHFDAAHYIEFYQVFGFPEETKLEQLLYKTDNNNNILPLEKNDAEVSTVNAGSNPLLVTNKKLTIKNTSVKAKTYDGKPGSYDGVKINSDWRSWASKVVSSRIRQQFLFCYWKDHFWNPCMKKYEKANNDNATLQNVIRCARAKSSSTPINTSKNTSELVKSYISEFPDRRVRRIIQSVNIKRAIVLIDDILKNERNHVSNSNINVDEEDHAYINE